MSSTPKAPAYQEYPADILNNEIFVRMNYEERGLLWTLRMYCWGNETLPKGLDLLAQICRLETDEFERLWTPRVSKFFEECPGNPSRIRNISLEAYRKDMLTRRKRRQEAGKQGADARWVGRGDGTDQVYISGETEVDLNHS
jgi:hypothetical protein